MSSYLEKVEEVLLPLAEKCTPEGSEPKAVIHQWLHAFSNQSGFFALPEDTGEEMLSDALKSVGLSKNELKQAISESAVFPVEKKTSFNFIDLFAGIGGFRLSLQSFGGNCVFSSEWDKSAQKTYLKNYGEMPFGDITSLTNSSVPDHELARMIPDHDVIAAGFPCQPFSHAGVSARTAVGIEHGFKCETQGTLFFDVLRIAQVKKPKVLFLENVRNLERHDKGRTFDVIRRSIDELGYDFQYKIIDSSTMVPQRRVRCYMVCFRKDLNVNFQFPDFSGDPLPLKSILEDNVSEKYTISEKLWQGHINRTKRNLERGTGFTAHTANLDKPSNTIVARYGKDGKECLIPQLGKTPRLLTPRECARLQGYPDNFWIPDVRTPAYKQFGNSVAVPVVKKIAKEITKVMQ